jgi:hypothetical protein
MRQSKTGKPEFKVNDKVISKKPTLYGETEGKVTEVGKIFMELDSHTGTFKRGGLATEERDIKSIQIPYEFDGETLKVHYPEDDYGQWIEKARTEVSKFYGYAYTVKTPKMLTLFAESSLKLKK